MNNYTLTEINSENKENINNNNINEKFLKIKFDKELYLYLSPDKNYISLTPIISINNIDILLKIYNLKNISKEKIENDIKIIIGEENLIKNISKKYKHNGIEIKKMGNDIKIIDNFLINDCTVLSKGNNPNFIFNIANKISTALFGKMISFEYLKKNENNNNIIVNLTIDKNIITTSDPSLNGFKAKINASIKFINKFLPEKNAKEIINNILVNFEKKEEKRKNIVFLKKKRNINHNGYIKDFSYFKGFNNNKIITNNNYSINIPQNIFCLDKKNIPVNEILLGDLDIVDNHLEDFKYTPIKMMEMIKNSEKFRGYDFSMDYSQINNRNLFYKIEVTITSQKLGIKAQGFGNSRFEAENKCALNCLYMIFKNKFKTFDELHEYFKNKNGKYLDIIL